MKFTALILVALISCTSVFYFSPKYKNNNDSVKQEQQHQQQQAKHHEERPPPRLEGPQTTPTLAPLQDTPSSKPTSPDFYVPDVLLKKHNRTYLNHPDVHAAKLLFEVNPPYRVTSFSPFWKKKQQNAEQQQQHKPFLHDSETYLILGTELNGEGSVYSMRRCVKDAAWVKSVQSTLSGLTCNFHKHLVVTLVLHERCHTALVDLGGDTYPTFDAIFGKETTSQLDAVIVLHSTLERLSRHWHCPVMSFISEAKSKRIDFEVLHLLEPYHVTLRSREDWEAEFERFGWKTTDNKQDGWLHFVKKKNVDSAHTHHNELNCYKEMLSMYDAPRRLPYRVPLIGAIMVNTEIWGNFPDTRRYTKKDDDDAADALCEMDNYPYHLRRYKVVPRIWEQRYGATDAQLFEALVCRDDHLRAMRHHAVVKKRMAKDPALRRLKVKEVVELNKCVAFDDTSIRTINRTSTSRNIPNSLIRDVLHGLPLDTPICPHTMDRNEFLECAKQYMQNATSSHSGWNEEYRKKAPFIDLRLEWTLADFGKKYNIT